MITIRRGVIKQRYFAGGVMHWSEGLIVITSLVTIVFIIRTMKSPLKRLGRWRYREEWIIVGLLFFIVMVTLTIASIRS
jgi:hypothetical protein